MLVGIDSLNIDSTIGGERPAHTKLLAAGIPIVEHLTNLSELPRCWALGSPPCRPRSPGWGRSPCAPSPSCPTTCATTRNAVCGIVVDCHDPAALAGFWSHVLGGERAGALGASGRPCVIRCPAGCCSRSSGAGGKVREEPRPPRHLVRRPRTATRTARSAARRARRSARSSTTTTGAVPDPARPRRQRVLPGDLSCQVHTGAQARIRSSRSVRLSVGVIARTIVSSSTDS